MNLDIKKIAFFLPSLEGGGTEKNAINLFKNIDRQEYDVSFVLAEKKGEFLKLVPKEVKIVDLETKTKAYFKVFLKLIKYFRKETPDILVSAFPHFNIMCLVAKIITGSKTKIIITEHLGIFTLPKTASSRINSFVSRFLLPFCIKIFYPKSDAIICVSIGVSGDILKIVKKQINLSVIYNPIDINEIKKLAEEPFDDSWFVVTKTPIIIMTGRLNKQKDYPTALMALKIINEKKEARLVILGKGKEKNNLKELVSKLGLNDKVLFLGFKDNPFKYIKHSSVFVLSSLSEGFGNVLVEAMACRIPVVSTDCDFGPREIIENNKNGFLVPIKNPIAMAEAVLKILNNSDIKNNLIEEGEKRAEDFSAEKITKEYENIFKEILKK